LEASLGGLLARVLGAPSARELRLAPMAVIARPDAAALFAVRAGRGVRPAAVVLCAPPDAPDVVARGVEAARIARAAMPPDLARHVLVPLAVGRVRGMSYAVHAFCASLATGHIAWPLQRARLAPALLRWLWRVDAATVRGASEETLELRFAAALDRLASVSMLTPAVRDDAHRAATRLRRRGRGARTVLMHGDLWKGNVLLRPPTGALDALAWAQRFVVIDWPACAPQGHPIYDLVRLAQSMNLSPARLRSELVRHCALLECEPEDTMTYLLAACGDIAGRLQHFPMDRFASMVAECHRRLLAALPAPVR
jgi:hypothetical protein